MAKPQITREALRAMARMSGLELSEERLEVLLPEVQRVVEAMEELDVQDFEHIEPAVVFHDGGVEDIAQKLPQKPSPPYPRQRGFHPPLDSPNMNPGAASR